MHGNPVDGHYITRARSFSRNFYDWLVQHEREAKTWTKVDMAARETYYEAMRRKFPVFQLCEFNWKLTKFMHDVYYEAQRATAKALAAKLLAEKQSAANEVKGSTVVNVVKLDDAQYTIDTAPSKSLKRATSTAPTVDKPAVNDARKRPRLTVKTDSMDTPRTPDDQDSTSPSPSLDSPAPSLNVTPLSVHSSREQDLLLSSARSDSPPAAPERMPEVCSPIPVHADLPIGTSKGKERAMVETDDSVRANVLFPMV